MLGHGLRDSLDWVPIPIAQVPHWKAIRITMQGAHASYTSYNSYIFVDLVYFPIF